MGLKQIALPIALPGVCTVLPITRERPDGHCFISTWDGTKEFCTGCGATRPKG